MKSGDILGSESMGKGLVLESRQDRNHRIGGWLTESIVQGPVELKATENLKYGSEREVWNCRIEMSGNESSVFLAIFKSGTLETVNTSLVPEQAVEKCVLAMRELPAIGIPTPRVLGSAVRGREAAMVSETIEGSDWSLDTRVEAAKILANIHRLDARCLSPELQRLARVSDPREYRTTGGVGPKPGARTLVHGDYFSKNIIPHATGPYVIDWETFAWGDPMWDLGFLIGADRNLSDGEIDAVIAEYGRHAPLNLDHLMWHRRRWAQLWDERQERSM